MVELSRRSALIGALFAPAIIRLPRLLMPVSPRHAQSLDTITLFDESGAEWTLPVRDGYAEIQAAREIMVRSATLVKLAGGLVVRADLSSPQMRSDRTIRIARGDYLHVSGLGPVIV